MCFRSWQASVKIINQCIVAEQLIYYFIRKHSEARSNDVRGANEQVHVDSPTCSSSTFASLVRPPLGMDHTLDNGIRSQSPCDLLDDL